MLEIRRGKILRAHLRAEPDTWFLFGDNMQRRGYGGQAREMRGEPNAIGVPTKWRPDMDEGAFFSDADMNGSVLFAIAEAFGKALDKLKEGKTVVLPAAGLGTGYAQLPTRAPAINRFILDWIDRLASYRID